MRIPVLIEPLAIDRYRAVGPAPELTAEGRTSEEARERLEELVRARVTAGMRLSWVETDAGNRATKHPLAKHAGAWKGDPLFDEYREAVEEYRMTRDPQDHGV